MMKLNDKQTAAAIIAVGMAFMGMAIRNGIVTFKDRDRTVAVKGLCEREVKADKVTWSLTYKEIGNDPSAMYDLLEQKNRKVVAFLKSAGVSDKEISINPAVISDRQADNYGNEIMNYRYKASSVITVTSTDIDKVRQLMRRQAELMKQGIAIVSDEYSSNVRYEFTGLNKIKQDMVEEATKNAQATAEQFATDTKSDLGDIRSAQQGQFSIEDRDSNTPYIKKIRVVNTMTYSLK